MSVFSVAHITTDIITRNDGNSNNHNGNMSVFEGKYNNESDYSITSNVPISFIPNVGQTDPFVLFMAKGSGNSFSFLKDSLMFSLDISEDVVNTSPKIVSQQFIGCNDDVLVSGEKILPGSTNYYLGGDMNRWYSNISSFESIRYHDLYPDIDLLYYGNGSILKREFIIAPGGDPSKIRMYYEGADSVHIDSSGSLKITTNSSSLVESKPVCYQSIDENIVLIEAEYLIQDGEVRIKIGEYDSSYPLIIDPNLIYSTYLGANDDETGYSIAVDGSGMVYIIGSTESTNFPTTSAYQSSNQGYSDVFILKFDPSNNRLLYSTYLGGSSYDWGLSIDTDSAGNAYVTGATKSSNFPVLNALKSVKSNDCDAFVAKLNSNGGLVYSTYYGGNGRDTGRGIAVDGSGNAYIVGTTNSDSLSTAGSYQSGRAGNYDVFVVKLNAAGGGPVYSTYLGGTNNDDGYGIAVDSAGCAYITGKCDHNNYPYSATHFPVTEDAFQTVNGAGEFGDDAFVTKLNPYGSGLLYSTYLGGDDSDWGMNIAVDSAGYAYITGTTTSADFPLRNALQSTYKGLEDAFVTRLNPSGSDVIFSTYLGGSNYDCMHEAVIDAYHQFPGIAIDSSGNSYITGYTESQNFPISGNALDSANIGTDAFVTELSPMGSLVYSSFFGGSSNDYAQDIAVDTKGMVYFTGETQSSDLPVTEHAFQPTKSNYYDLFITKMSLSEAGTNSASNMIVFRGNKWYLDYNGNGAWGTGDKQFTFGQSGDKPVSGDWNGDAKSDIGIFRGNKWYLDSSGNGIWGNGDKTFTFGLSGDNPVTGDWNGDGKTDIGVFRGNKWYLDSNGNGIWGSGDKSYTFGLSGDKPVTGDWNKDGKTDIGVFRGNKWYLDSNGNGVWGSTDKTYTFGQTGDIPVTGKWSGLSGTASIQSVELNPVTKSDSVFKVPDVTRPVAAVPKVEMPVKSSSDIHSMTPGVVPSQYNPFLTGGAAASRNALI